MKWLLLTVSCLLLLPNFFNFFIEPIPEYNHKEKFDPSLSYINSTEKLIGLADSVAVKNNIPQRSLQYADVVSSIIKQKFYHGFSRYPVYKNWIASFSEHLFGHGLSALVKPDDILKFNYGGCSQQSIVLIEVMKRKKIPYRSVGFPHHFATELKFNNNWYFFDPNMEPEISDSNRSENNWKTCADSLKKYYDTSRFHDLDWKFGKNVHTLIGKENADPAPNAKLFQSTTFYLSKLLWLLPLMLAFYPKKKISNRTKFFTPNY